MFNSNGLSAATIMATLASTMDVAAITVAASL